MWREFFGPQARIIGVDFNPAAKRWEQDGFEIHIGDQAKPESWQALFAKIGTVDVLLDDGGHTFEQQIVTVCEALPHIRDGGMIAVEDTHTSYFKDFGYPTRYSFIEWAKVMADNINTRFPGINQPFSRLPYKDSVFSLHFYESIVGFKIRRDICTPSHPVSNGAPTAKHEDYRNKTNLIGTVEARSNALARRLDFLRTVPVLWRGLACAGCATCFEGADGCIRLDAEMSVCQAAGIRSRNPADGSATAAGVRPRPGYSGLGPWPWRRGLSAWPSG